MLIAMMNRQILLVTALLALISASVSCAQTIPDFTDITAAAGLVGQRKLQKYGGPTLADLDNDGHLDLLFHHHDKGDMEIWFNRGGGRKRRGRRGNRIRFVKSPWTMYDDMHGVVVSPISARSRDVKFVVSTGGNFGMDPSYARVFTINSDNRDIIEVSEKFGMDKKAGRGRTSLALSLSGPNSKDHSLLDIMHTNAQPTNSSDPRYWAYKSLGRGTYGYRPLRGYNPDTELAIATDIDSDGTMEVVSYSSKFTVHKQVGAFKMKDITNRVLDENSFGRVGTMAVVEFDYNGDGQFDLFLARGHPPWFINSGFSFDDVLLENRDGVYVDVSRKVGIPRGGNHTGVTAGDFNNDGHVDLLVFRYSKPDIMLLNDGEGKFTKVENLIARPRSTSGDMGMAADIDMDGRLDLALSQGDHDFPELGGTYRILQNTSPRSRKANFLLVHVGHAPDRTATSLYAVVTVRVNDTKMYRRVGTPGSQVSRSFIEVVHFGLGAEKEVDSVMVQWSSGIRRRKTGVEANTKLTFGYV